MGNCCDDRKETCAWRLCSWGQSGLSAQVGRYSKGIVSDRMVVPHLEALETGLCLQYQAFPLPRHPLSVMELTPPARTLDAAELE